MANNNNQSNPLSDFINSVASSPQAQPIINTLNSIGQNKFVRGALQSAENSAQDIGTGIRNIQEQPTLQNNEQLAQQFERQAQQTNDPQKKAILLKNANQIRIANSNEAGNIASGFSQDVNQNPLLRGVMGGTEIGTTADMVAHPVQTVQGIGSVAKAVLHPIQTLRTGAGLLTDLPGTVKKAGEFIQGELKNPDNFRNTGGNNALTTLGNKILASQFKGGDKVVRNPQSTISDLAQYGLTSPEQIANASSVVTGSANAPEGKAILNKAVTRAVNSVDHIQTGDVVDPNTGAVIQPGMYQNAKNLLENTTFMTPFTQKRILNQVMRAGNVNAGIEGGNPDNMMQVLRGWESKVNDVTDVHGNLKPNLTAEEKETGRVYQGLIQDLKQRIFTTSGVNDQPLADFLSPADIKALSDIHPQLATDAQNATVLEGRGLQARFVNGSKMVNASNGADESALDPGDILTGGAVAAGNPIGAATVAAANTQGGKNAIGNTLRAIGSTYSRTPAQIPLDASVQLPRLPGSANNNQNENSVGYDTNQGNKSPFSDQTISNSAYNVKYDQIPTDSSALKPDANGLYSAPNPQNIMGSDGQSLLASGIKDLDGNDLPPMNNANYKALKVKYQSPEFAYNPNAQKILDQAATANTNYNALSTTYANYVNMNNKIANAVTALSGAPSNVLNNVKSIDQLQSISNGKYRAVAEALRILGKDYPTDVSGILGAKDVGTAISDLQAISKDTTGTYNNFINDYTGNLPGVSSPNPGSSTAAVPQSALPPLSSGNTSNAGYGTPHPFVY